MKPQDKKETGPVISAEILKILKHYDLDSSAVWEVRNGAFAILHKAIEKIAKQEKIVFSEPEILLDGLNSDNRIVLRVGAELNGRKEWSFGECDPKNNKNAYPWAMAEKRAKDRVVLKLIDIHGDLYSEDELDGLTRFSKAKARSQYERIQAEIDAADSADALTILYKGERSVIELFPEDWEEEIIERFADRKRTLAAERQAAE